ncbi:hypothetical protein M3Y98_00304200 [Aphelenchoides besseyi]|nr:hypothetical protein M3Y98_00304200 [Aphelenchoides besseyi]
MNEELPSSPTSNANSAATSWKFGRAQSNCVPLSTSTSIQQSSPTIFYKNRTSIMSQPQTIPPTPPANAMETQSAYPLISPLTLMNNDESNVGEMLTSRTQLLSVSQMVRQHSDTTNNRRLIRSGAIVCDDRPATSSNTATNTQPQGRGWIKAKQRGLLIGSRSAINNDARSLKSAKKRKPENENISTGAIKWTPAACKKSSSPVYTQSNPIGLPVI